MIDNTASRRAAIALCRALVRLAAPVVPGDRRADWIREWDGEIAGFSGLVRPDGAAAGTMELVRRCAGALPHAWSLRRLAWSSVAHDFRFGVRLLRRQPGFTLAVVATIAIGIGGATAMFSIVHAVLLKPLPYHDTGRLVWMFGAFRSSDSAAVSPPDFLDYRRQQDVFSSFAAMMIAPEGVTVAGPEGPERLLAMRATAGFLTTLGAPPAAGRDFVRGDESLGAPRVAIISERLWQQRFGVSPAVLGMPITIDRETYAIIGVLPSGFQLPLDPFIRLGEPVDLLLPFPFDADEAKVRRFHFLRVIGRLAPGVEITAAQSRMDVIARQLEAAYPENATWRLRLLPLRERLVGQLRPALTLLMAAVLLLLLIACSNVTGLLLARSTTRGGEVALRSALGASRARVARQLLAEAAVLSTAGAASGLLLARWIVGLLGPAAGGTLPPAVAVTIDPVVLAFAVVVACGSAVVFGLVPAMRLPMDPRPALDDGVRASAGRGRARLRAGLVALQVALSLALVIAAGLLARSFARLQAVDLGFATDVLMAQVSLPPEVYRSERDVELFFTALSERLTALPGVEAAALATSPPLIGGNDTAVHPEGRPPASQADRQFAQVRWIQGRYFEALQVPSLKGRVFDDRLDLPDGFPVVVISRRLADQLFPGEDALGRRIVVDLRQPVVAEIVGIVADARIFGQGNEAPPLLYMSARQFPTNTLHIMARTEAGAAALTKPIRAVVHELDPTLAVARVQSMRDRLRESVAQPRLRTGIVGAFAAIAVVLALTGIYGVIVFAVGQRTREIGIRMALGATRGDVLRMVLRQGALLIAPGIVGGLLIAYVAGGLMSTLLFEVPPTDLAVFVAAAVMLAGASLVAVAVPARRASRIEPVRALRAE